MTKFSNKTIFLAAALAAICAFMSGACTKVDNSLGYNLLPDNQRMTVHIDTIYGARTFLFRHDSVSSSNLGKVYFGSEYSPEFGLRRNGFIIQFLPTSIPYEDGFGTDPIVDTLYLSMAITQSHGNTDVEQTFEVLQVYCDTLSADSTYYSNFPVSRFIRDGQVLFTFKHSGKGEAMIVPLEPTPLGREFMKSLVELDSAAYRNDSLFHSIYNGLYIRPAAGSPDDAATFAGELTNSGTYMVLNLRNHDPIDHTLIKDTLSTTFSIYDGSSYGNLSVNLVEFDYSGTELETLRQQTGNFTDTANTVSTCYVQTMGGVGTRISLDRIAEQLSALRVNSEGDTLSIMINQAMMHISTEQQGTDILDKAPVRVGSYLNMSNLTPIPDYMYAYERSTQVSNESYVLPYNGFLNRSNYDYPLDISSYVQHLMANEELPSDSDRKLSETFYISSPAYDFFGFGNVKLNGYGSRMPVYIVVTYTLIEK